MESKELRIGNLVKDRGGKILTVDSIYRLGDNYYKIEMIQKVDKIEVHPLTEYSDYLKPIPLTEQWLIDFGFTKWRNKKIWSLWSVMIYYKKDIGFCYGKSSSRTQIPHIHTLQNLIFALTGKELIKTK